MIDVDSKISKYLEARQITKSLRKEVDHLRILARNLEETIEEKNNYIKELNNEVLVSMKVDDLLNHLSKLLNIDKNEIDVKITVISGTYAKTLNELYNYERKDAKDLNSYLSIRLKDGTNICTKDLRLFNSVNEVQSDGYILLRHCRLESTGFQRYNLVVDKNINEIICNFRIDALDMDNYDRDQQILPMAIKEYIKEQNAKIPAKTKKRQYVKK